MQPSLMHTSKTFGRTDVYNNWGGQPFSELLAIRKGLKNRMLLVLVTSSSVQ